LWDLIARQMSLADRFHWRVRRAIFGLSGTARRRPPFSEYFGPSVARVGKVVEVVRAEIQSPVASDAEATSVAREARNVLAHELRFGFDGITRLRSITTSGAVPLPNPNATLNDAERVMQRAFRASRSYRIELPTLAPPDEVGAFVERAIAGKN
jgi:hypothetical protein